MNNYIVVIITIIIIFVFSGDKNLFENIINNKSLILLLIVYFIYNNFSLIFLLIGLIGFILTNEAVRQIIYERYDKYIDKGKDHIKKFLNIEEQNNEINKHSVMLEKLIDEQDKKIEYSSSDEHIPSDITSIDIDNEENTEDNNALQKLLDEIEI